MIFRSLCNSCLQPYELRLLPDDQVLLASVQDENKLVDCPRLCGGKINAFGEETITAMTSKPGMKEPIILTGTELYQAVNGSGLPDEHVRDATVVAAFLKSSPVKEIDIREQDGHLYLDAIHLSGTTIHLTAGARGAEVYKVTKKRGDV